LSIRSQPTWLRQLGKGAATGDVWRMTDAYGARIALIAGFSYPRGVDPSVFLFDVEASGFVELIEPGVHDDVQGAAAVWRATVGDSADGVEPHRVDSAAELLPLAHLRSDDSAVTGVETRAAMDNWFRARRRVADLTDALRRTSTPLSVARHDEFDPLPMVEEFRAWHVRRHGVAPHEEAVEDLVWEWTEGLLPETWYVASPGRVEFVSSLVGDWVKSEITTAALTLIPEWTRWLGERAELPPHLIERAVSAARR
jgi:hypothetical protein